MVIATHGYCYMWLLLHGFRVACGYYHIWLLLHGVIFACGFVACVVAECGYCHILVRLLPLVVIVACDYWHI